MDNIISFIGVWLLIMVLGNEILNRLNEILTELKKLNK